MHAAPSVSYPVGRSAFALACLALPWLGGLAAVTAWSMQSPAPDGRQGLAWLAVAACGLAAAWAWLRSPRGTLAWDGGGWQWREGEGNALPGQPDVALDLQSRLLLRWQGEDGAVRWLCLERGSAAPHWDALRRAVYSRPSTGAPHGAQPPVARQ